MGYRKFEPENAKGVVCVALLAVGLLANLHSIRSATPPAAGLTLKDVFDSALAKTEPVKISSAQANEAEERYAQAKAKILPTVSLVGGYTRIDTPSSTLGGVTGTLYPADQTLGKISLLQPLFKGFGEWAGLKGRDHLAEAGKLQVEAKKLALYTSVAQAYYAVLAAEKDLENLKGLYELTGKRVKELGGFVHVGRSRSGELLTAQAQEISLEAQMVQATQAVNQARQNFSYVTGLSETAPLLTEVAMPSAMPGLDMVLGVLEKRPDIEASRLSAQAAEEDIAVARAGHFPSLDLAANYYFLRTGALKDSKWDIGVQLSIPLFAGGGVLAQTREASERHTEFQLVYEQAKRQAATDVRNLYKNLTAYLSQAKTLERVVGIAQKNYHEQSRDYNNGLVTNLDVLTALNAYQESQRTLDKTRFTALTTYASLQAAMGQLPQTGQ